MGGLMRDGEHFLLKNLSHTTSLPQHLSEIPHLPFPIPPTPHHAPTPIPIFPTQALSLPSPHPHNMPQQQQQQQTQFNPNPNYGTIDPIHQSDDMYINNNSGNFNLITIDNNKPNHGNYNPRIWTSAKPFTSFPNSHRALTVIHQYHPTYIHVTDMR